MKKIITLVTAGIFLLSLQIARAQKEVAPPAVPPMLEGQRPLATPETKEPAAPQKKGEEEKAKPKAKGKAKTAPKIKTKTAAKKNGTKAPTKKKGSKGAGKSKKPASEPAAPAATPGPDEG
jgi:hypothetical protein